MSIDLRHRMPAQELMEQLVLARDTGQVRELPFGIVRLSRDAMGWYRGARGELEVADRLTRLGVEWAVLHSLPVGTRGSDIDHLAVGPGGVFAINTKRHRGKRVWVAGGRLLVDGRRTDHIRNSWSEARRVEALLAAAGIDVPVTPVVALSGAESLTVKAPAEWRGGRVEVVEATRLVKRMRRERTLSPEQVIAIDALLVDPAFWGTGERTATDPHQLRATYRAIDRGIARWNGALGLGALLLAGLAVSWWTFMVPAF